VCALPSWHWTVDRHAFLHRQRQHTCHAPVSTPLPRAEAGALQLEFAEFALISLLRPALQSFVVPASFKRVQLILVMRDVPRNAVGDAQRLKQVLCNLLSNAIKFSPEGGKVIVHVSVVDAASPSYEDEVMADAHKVYQREAEQLLHTADASPPVRQLSLPDSREATGGSGDDASTTAAGPSPTRGASRPPPLAVGTNPPTPRLVLPPTASPSIRLLLFGGPRGPATTVRSGLLTNHSRPLPSGVSSATSPIGTEGGKSPMHAVHVVVPDGAYHFSAPATLGE